VITIDEADLRRLEQSEAKAYRVERGGALNGICDVVDSQAIDGQLLKFNTVFPYRGDLVMLRSGCFGTTINHRVAVWLDHEPSTEVGSTDDALSLMIDDEGVQFRLDLANCRIGPALARMVTTDNRSATSVGSDIHEEHKQDIDGQTVRVVTRAKLREATICAQGAAGENAFCYLIDKTYTPPPVAGSRSPTFRAAQTLHRVSRSVRALKASMAETYSASPPAKRTFTLDQLNRMQSAETERLQDRARQLQNY
jgi:HK97 family phage prohead protease